MYTLLLTAPGNSLDQPITKFVPELVNATSENLGDGPTWEDVTIRSLAGQLSGLGRDYGNYDFANEAANLTAFGFPALTAAQAPTCGQGFTNKSAIIECTREDFIQGIIGKRAVTSPFSTPIYSNFAYIFIGYAIESITGKSFFDSFTDAVGKPLGLKRTSLSIPNDKNTIIPGNPATNSWTVDAGDENPTGGFYSSLSDVTAIAQSILNLDLLRPVVTRSWMKPLAHTANLRNAVGAPWEIYRQEIPVSGISAANNTRVVDLYAKSGDLGGAEHYYGTLTTFDMDHHFGFNILATGKKASSVRWTLGSMLSEVFVNAFEAAARDEADAKFAGTYESTGNGPASNLTLTLDDSRPGLGVSEWYNNGINILNSLRTYRNIPTAATLSLRLYPMIKFGNELTFRSVIEVFPQGYITGPMATDCITWPTVDGLQYGGAGVDEFAFKIENGAPAAVTPRAMRQTLTKQR
ncbi:uncharacterized protein A1O9_00893 [Exophiala aquamarina CBS 119918]|uniref:Uncharacterized protein n=1 Tax=Exophiala aquamarina CBS 119918 TaxID=1182545 RepID=A0A072PS47_9EURO|nr:uncharacterized protein A1O9_00893 [Exophiala aquamarina CBS 119918]KEF62919.1 hypothetical protein A1O9_00893 [Exophiala aquamarina CBS 119918]